MVIRQIGVASLAKMMGVLYGLLGVIIGCLFAVISIVSAGVASQSPEELAWAAPLFGVGAVVFLPILYGVFGVIGGALLAFLYNVVAGMVGGVQIETQ